MSVVPDRDELYARIAQGMGAWVVLWFLMTLWEPSSNTLVRFGLLVSSQKEHLFGLPLQDTGITARALLAVLSVGIVVGFAYSYVRYISPKSLDEPPPPSAARHVQSYPPDPPMGGMPPMGGGGYGAPPYGPPGGQYPPPGFGNPPPPGMYSG